LRTHLGGAHALARVGRRAAHTSLGRTALRPWGHLRSAMRGRLIDGGIARWGNATLARRRVGVRWAYARLYARRGRVVGGARRGLQIAIGREITHKNAQLDMIRRVMKREESVRSMGLPGRHQDLVWL
jgi:hypothetical protein